MSARKTYEHKTKKVLRTNSDFLVRRLREEWDATEKGARHEERMRRAKDSAKAVGRGLLALLVTSGFVTVMAVAPNMFAAVGKMKGRKRFAEKGPMREAVRRLQKSGYVKSERVSDHYILRLTKEGADVILTQALNDLRVRHKGAWDGQWRFVFFDIPNRHKWARDAFRRQLDVMGFYRIQESVFVYPFPCEEEIRYLTDIFGISQYVRFLAAREISDDADLRSFFSM